MTAADTGRLSLYDGIMMNVPQHEARAPDRVERRNHVLINGLSMGTGGGYTVGVQLLRHLALVRPGWMFTFASIAGVPLHEQLKRESLPSNCQVLWAPPTARGRLRRTLWERRQLARYARTQGVSAIVQLNGLVVPGIGIPTLSHNQDPWPYRPEAWASLKEQIIAALKRHAHGRALREAACLGWTSHYLEELICGWHGLRPQASEVFYNGLPDGWLKRAEALTDWESRPMQIVTVSNVEPYKRQDLVIRAVAQLVQSPQFKGLRYFILGQCTKTYRHRLRELTDSLGVGERVAIEGRVPDERVRELLGSSRCFALMSVCESFGIPAIEAMSFGTPVVTSDCCAMPEVCADAADLCTPDALDELTEKIGRALTDRDHAEELRRRGAERVQHFQWRTTAERMAKRLEQIAST